MIFLLPVATFSAEILQIKKPNIILIGDNNRSYLVQVDCIEVDSKKSDMALSWLREEFPRHTRLNIKPKGFIEGVLVANLIDIKSNRDLAKTINSEGFGKMNCIS